MSRLQPDTVHPGKGRHMQHVKTGDGYCTSWEGEAYDNMSRLEPDTVHRGKGEAYDNMSRLETDTVHPGKGRHMTCQDWSRILCILGRGGI